MVSAMEANEGPFIHLSSVFMSNGRADTPSHSVLVSCRFRFPAFDQRQHNLCGCATCVGRLVFVAGGRPLSQEKPLDKLCCCLSAETRLHDVGHGSSRGSDHSRWDWASHGPLRGHHGHLSSIWYCWGGFGNIILQPVCLPTVLEEIRWCFHQTRVHLVGHGGSRGSGP